MFLAKRELNKWLEVGHISYCTQERGSSSCNYNPKYVSISSLL
jgi:hypothetical protein